MSQDNTYTIQPVEEDDVEHVMNLLEKTFYVDEPLNEAVELWSEDQPCTELADYCRHSLMSGLSFKAVDTQGNIVGVTISGVSHIKEEDATNMLKEADECKNPKFQKILYILAQREVVSRLWEKFPDHKSLVEVKVAATDPNWRKRGIMNKLIEETEKATKQRGIYMLRLDTSSAYSAMSAEKQGFSCVYSARYDSITRHGRPIIVPKPPHVEDRVYVKIL